MAKKIKNANSFASFMKKNFPGLDYIKAIHVPHVPYTCSECYVLLPGPKTITNRDNTATMGHVSPGEFILPLSYNTETKKFTFPEKAYRMAREKVTVLDKINPQNHQKMVRICKIVWIDKDANIVKLAKIRKERA